MALLKEERMLGSSQSLEKERQDLGRTRDNGWKKLNLGVEEPEEKHQWGVEAMIPWGTWKTWTVNSALTQQNKHYEKITRTLHIKISLSSQTQEN